MGFNTKFILKTRIPGQRVKSFLLLMKQKNGASITHEEIDEAMKIFLSKGGEIKKYNPQYSASILVKDILEEEKEDYKSMKMDTNV